MPRQSSPSRHSTGVPPYPGAQARFIAFRDSLGTMDTLPSSCLENILGFLELEDRSARPPRLQQPPPVQPPRATPTARPSRRPHRRLRCRLVKREWADAAFSGDLVVRVGSLEASHSLAFFLSRTRLCAQLRGLTLSFSDVSGFSYHPALILLVPHACPNLQRLSLSCVHVQSFTSLVRSPAALSAQLRDVRVRVPHRDVSPLALLPHMHTLHVDTLLALPTVFEPRAPLPALHTLAIAGRAKVAWAALPNLRHLHFESSTTPFDYSAFASSLESLTIAGMISDTKIVHGLPLPRLHSLSF